MRAKETQHFNQTLEALQEQAPADAYREGIALDAVRIIEAMYLHLNRFDRNPKEEVYERLAEIPLPDVNADVKSDVTVRNFLETIPCVIHSTDPVNTPEYSQDHWWLPRDRGVARVTRTRLVIPAIQIPAHDQIPAYELPAQANIIYCMTAGSPNPSK